MLIDMDIDIDSSFSNIIIVQETECLRDVGAWRHTFACKFVTEEGAETAGNYFT
jgi:hypothetical protein